MDDLDERVGLLLASGDPAGATAIALRQLGPEVLGFLTGVLGNEVEADEVFAMMSERLWHSLRTFEGRSSIRTWMYVLARHEMARYRRGMRRDLGGRVPIPELQDVVTAVLTTKSSFLTTGLQTKVRELREALSEDDRALLILRLDRDLGWDEIAIVLAGPAPAREENSAERPSEEARKREAARLRQRFQLVKGRLAAEFRRWNRTGGGEGTRVSLAERAAPPPAPRRR